MSTTRLLSCAGALLWLLVMPLTAESDTPIELTAVTVRPEGHVGLEWINRAGELMGYVEVASDPRFKSVVGTFRFNYGQAGFFLPPGDHLYLRLGSLDKSTNQGGGPWSKTLEVVKSGGGWVLASEMAQAQAQTAPATLLAPTPHLDPPPQLAVQELKHVPLGTEQTLEVFLAVTLPSLSRTPAAGSALYVQPIVAGKTFGGSGTGGVTNFDRTYTFAVQFRETRDQVPLSVFNEATPFDLLVFVDENNNSQPDAGEYQSRLKGLTWSTVANKESGPRIQTSRGPRIRLALRSQTQGVYEVQDGGEYYLGTWAAGQVFEGNYLDVDNVGDAPLTLLPQKNGKFLGVEGDGMLRTYNYEDIGKAPIPPTSGLQGKRASLGLSVGDWESKPGTHHVARMTIQSNDPINPSLRFTLTFDLAQPGPTLGVNQSREHFGKALVPTWSNLNGAVQYELVRKVSSDRTPYETVYRGSATTFEDLDLEGLRNDQQVHYFVRAQLGDGRLTAWSTEAWSNFPQQDSLDPYEYTKDRQSDGEFVGAVPLRLGERQNHNFYPLEDNDWLWFTAKKGTSYQVRVVPIDESLILKFHMEVGTNPQKLNGPYHESSIAKPVVLTWKAQGDGKVWIRLRGRAGMASANPWYTIELLEKKS